MHGARRNVAGPAPRSSAAAEAFVQRPARPAPMRRKRRRPTSAQALNPCVTPGSIAASASLCSPDLGAIVLGLAVIYFIASVPDPVDRLARRPAAQRHRAGGRRHRAGRARLHRGHVRLDALPPYLVQAVLATEDRRFYRHFGVDPLGLVRAPFERHGRHRGRRAARPSPSSSPRTCSSARAHLRPQDPRDGALRCGSSSASPRTRSSSSI